MKNGLYELVNYGKDIIMRKLLITYLSLQLAQSIGIDHHATKEELYYYMRTKDHETHTMLTEFMDHFYERVCKDKDEASPNRCHNTFSNLEQQFSSTIISTA